MRIAIGNKVTSFFGIRYELLLQKYRNRNPRVIAFQKALRKDLEDSQNRYENTLTHFRRLRFYTSVDLYEFLHTVAAIHNNEASEEELNIIFENWAKTSKGPTSGQWLEVSMCLLGMGFFEGAYMSRLMSYRTFESISSKLIYHLNYTNLLTALYFDQGETQKTLTLAQSSSVSKYWQSFFGKSDRKLLKEENTVFFNLLNKKRIAVIGPLEFRRDYSAEISRYDVIVELNPLLSKRESVKNKYHGKPDVIYYSNFRLDELEKINYSDVVDSAKYAVLKTRKHYKRLKERLPARVLPSTSILNWNGSFSMMENVVADLLLFEPTELKVFGVNLYTSFDYARSYGNSAPENIRQITLNFTVHDIFTQYMFMHNLYKLELISGDEEFEKVLQLGIEGYVKRMSELYPKFLLTNKGE